MTATRMRYHKRNAERDGHYLKGFEPAQQAFFSFVDQNTILVTHAAQNDLEAPRLVHNRIVDTQILTTNKVRELYPGAVNPYSLKQITYEIHWAVNSGFDGH
ncbi:hypothetical protein ASPCAL09999 [Aspergillus calidoustus]|uniref:Uncharacterized protein n=1 Tax=Aspergillus calidoustus TaxID=454130 RepID=A0A0U5G588_ASPCI|nr:hypothetical protein ASPCAL09999 [Aspergillus calidoustus]